MRLLVHLLSVIGVALAGSVDAATVAWHGFQVETQACWDEPFCPAVLRLVRNAAYEFACQEDGAPMEIHVRDLTTRVGDFPLLVAICASPGGSDHHFETTFISLSEARPIEVADHIRSSIQDAICFGRFTARRVPGFLEVHFIWGDDEVHYSNHRYEATLFLWNGSRFVKADHRETRRKHSSWAAAVGELGYSCRIDILRSVPGERWSELSPSNIAFQRTGARIARSGR
jgi:hypothetical protein